MSELIVRQMVATDKAAFARLADDADVQTLSLFVHAKSRGEDVSFIFNKLLEIDDEGYYRSFVIEKAGIVQGYMSCTEQPVKPHVYWLGGFVHADARRQGIASGGRLALMDMVRSEYEGKRRKLRPIFRVQVRPENLPAIHMVQKIGFIETDAPKSAVHAISPMRHFVRC